MNEDVIRSLTNIKGSIPKNHNSVSAKNLRASFLAFQQLFLMLAATPECEMVPESDIAVLEAKIHLAAHPGTTYREAKAHFKQAVSMLHGEIDNLMKFLGQREMELPLEARFNS